MNSDLKDETISVFIVDCLKPKKLKIKSIQDVLWLTIIIVIIYFVVAGFILSIQVAENNLITNPVFYLPKHPTAQELTQIKQIKFLRSKLKKELYIKSK